MSFQRGDVLVKVGARELVFRLTLGAFAEICERLGTSRVDELAHRLRNPSPADLLSITVCLLRPSHGAGAQALALSCPSHSAAPAIARLFEEAFA